jgi:tetratricopeptide (TPR) repeat protein
MGSRYQLHELIGVGSMGAVYRATDRLTQTTVALKRVTAELGDLGLVSPSSTAHDAALSLALAHEFQTLAALHHPNIIDVLDYGFDPDGPYFTMEYLPGALTITQEGHTLPLLGRIDLLVQVLQALAYLHRHDIVHRDLKPANILAHNGRVKVLDFGLSVKRALETQTSGTVAYMAPEVLAGQPATEASDLYAVGVIAYELFAGQHPFPAPDTSRLIHDIMRQPPDLAALHFQPAVTDTLTDFPPTLGAAMAQIISRLLAKDPADRYTSAKDVIGALGQALDRPDLAQESADVRESYLQAARFVGRSAERFRLNVALDEAMHGHGSVWLIAGESGVGKTRLLNEFRAPAMIARALVLSSQCAPGGGPPYRLWRDPVRRLALSTPLSDLDMSVLKAIVPDLDRLLGRAIPDAPSLEGRDARQRLAMTFVNLLHSQPQPVVLLLDDLQWIHESLLLLRELARMVIHMPVLVIGSYRDDERPDLPGELPGAHTIKLERFPTEQIMELSVSMLGDVGRQPRIVEFLERETEGNVFFVVETLRALAEEAGNLDAAATLPLPDHMFPKGVQAIAQRRLGRVPLDDQPLLRAAAIAGRQIDFNILRHLDPAVNLERWLLVCSEAGIVAFEDGQWQFAHNKLRDGILFGLADDQPPKLHRLVAQAIEALYPDDITYVDRLARHWRAAGDTPKEAHYARLAGQQMMSICHYTEALALFDRAAELTAPGPDAARIQLHRAETLYSQGDYAQARQVLETIKPIIQACCDPATIALAARILGNITQVAGEYDTARGLMQESLALSETAGDQLGVATALRNLGLIAENQGDLDQAVTLYIRSLDLFRVIDNRLGMAGATANLGSVALIRQQYDEASAYFDEALALFNAIGYRWGYAYTLTRRGEVAMKTGAYDRAEAALNESLQHCAEIGHRWGMAFAHIQLGHVTYAQRHYARAGAYYQAALRIAQDIQATPTVIEALVGMANFLRADEQYELAAELLSLALNHPATDLETRQRAQHALDSLASELFPDEFVAAARRGQDCDLDAALKVILTDDPA